ncbi:hypothetical protein TWF225_000203 [Orbilia oligospora]|uniref:Uncharacterized protein n=1 Tax=Orbilia oligospora TaxID=2813651 RepID=A0A7C8PXR2_ORBOL|nr:hypothetical protein TWF751_004236 [Orbilia oligospora]KAF3195828.1 hypothetical protein TWF225_000203 [Orbilia oligospora]KAF3266408.1 hypothetical protein TWF128_010816 [Orbilia oligospora]KAF3272256.1 hypothetical protein TWF217_004051 [Orbilia oligospora]KAF3297574.1 hypothetical protein TWF132_005994 [Orbilia oligospora]
MSTIGRFGRYVGSLRPPIRITISSPSDNDYQELKSDSILSRSPCSQRSSFDDSSFLPSPVSRTVSNDFSSEASDLVWVKLKIRNRTIFGYAYPRIIPRSAWGWPKRAYIQRQRRCTRRQCLTFVGIVILLAIFTPIFVTQQLKTWRENKARRGWGYGVPRVSGLDEWGWPLWEKTFQHLQHNYGGIKELVPKNENVPEYPPLGDEVEGAAEPTYSKPFASPVPVEFKPYPDYSSSEYRENHEGEYVPCRSFIEGEVLMASDPPSKVYAGIPWRKADAVIGSAELVGLDDTVCWERDSLLAPYGFGDNTTLPLHEDWKNTTTIDFTGVNWGNLQTECVDRNKARYNPSPTNAGSIPIWTPPVGNSKRDLESKPENSTEVSKYKSRTAVVLRAYDGFKFTPEDIINLRRLITELSLLSGGEYQVHVIIDVKDFEIPIWADEKTYQGIINKVVPEEFRGIVELTNEPMMAASYWSAPWHDSYWSLFMPLQLFSRRHPEYDYIWQWEMDMRLIGHHYHFLEGLAQWAKKQPRKELWERNARHYIPSVHGTWEEFSAWVSSLYPEANSTVWGPVLPVNVTAIDPPQPPVATPEEDNYEWGVGEEADLITLLPMFDPIGGTWNLANDCKVYEEKDNTPRRAAIVTASRLSKGLLWRMHEENSKRQHSCASEMWPATTAFHHGLKAVYAPHPMWFERDWQSMSTVDYLFNGGTKGSSNPESVFGINEHNFSGLTWFYNSRWARMLYRRWLGYEENGGGREWEAEHGNMCLNSVILHPVKSVTPANEH